jgi:hypothetical protein
LFKYFDTEDIGESDMETHTTTWRANRACGVSKRTTSLSVVLMQQREVIEVLTIPIIIL